MITFDKETRQFAIVGYRASAAIGGGINAVRNSMQRNKYEQQLINQGKTPEEAREAAKKRYGGTGKSIVKGAAAGVGARFVGGRVRNIGKKAIKAFPKNNLKIK